MNRTDREEILFSKYGNESLTPKGVVHEASLKLIDLFKKSSNILG